MSEKEIWLSNLVSHCHPFEGSVDEYKLIRTLLDAVDRLRGADGPSAYDFASAFDILVAAAYYGSVAHTGWIYCPDSALDPVIFYPYTNVCPSCAIRNKFIFHKANKPQFFDKSSGEWSERAYTIGSKSNRQDTSWAYKGFINLLTHDSEFFKNFVFTWRMAFESYVQRNQDTLYWLTNACGQPHPRPSDWPRRTGPGYESISDGKTSVGMDRTDDLKKATYQVLKIGAEGRPSMDYALKVGIVSNIHAARHFDDYLASLKDIVWARDETGQVKLAKHLSPDAEVYNLFDGIITLTQLFARDEWVRSTFDFVKSL